MMGSAIIKSLIKGSYGGKILAVDLFPEKLGELEKLGVKVGSDNKKAAASADIVFVIVKPGDVGYVLDEFSKKLKANSSSVLPQRFHCLILQNMRPKQKLCG